MVSMSSVEDVLTEMVGNRIRDSMAETRCKWMVYTVQMDLYIDDDEIYSDEDISNIIEESMSVASASVDHIKVIEVNDWEQKVFHEV